MQCGLLWKKIRFRRKILPLRQTVYFHPDSRGVHPSMATDPWGIDIAYNDGFWGPASPATRETLLAAMGVESANSVPTLGDPVRVIRQGTELAWEYPGVLTTEDGATLSILGAMPSDLPLGYHDFQGDDRPEPMRVIVVPRQCVPPPPPLWGWAVQLYATRSAESWGMGDLADLRRLNVWADKLGAGMLMLNPLSAAAPVLAQQASPYYPCSRRFLNPLYLRVEEVPGAREFGPMLERLASAGRVLNNQRRIDRDAVFRLKQEALKSIWMRTQKQPEFEIWRQQQGRELEQFAIYCTLAEEFGGDWRQWPQAYRAPESRAVTFFAEARAQEVRYHQWLQWLLDRQLAEASRPAMLLQDLPVGVDPGGADAWAWQDLLAQGCMVGAPPDLFNSLGQDWQLPPFIPHKLRAAAYEPFVQTIRGALRHAGGLRIDHVMGLFRLYWIPQGLGPRAGAYVRYRAEEMLGIVALESHRAGAFVVGEDLGNVEPGVREQLAEQNILSYRLLWFEEHPPAQYPELAMAAPTTHDLPTIAGMWSGRDLADQRTIHPAAEDSLAGIRHRLRELTGQKADSSIEDVIEAIYRLLAEAPCRLLTATIDDALAVYERPNMPGTIDEWPNWSIALPGGIPALERSELARRIASVMRRDAATPPARKDASGVAPS